MLNGLVYRSTGSWYDVKLESGEFIQARLVGKLRTKGIRTTNPIAVGDKVCLIIDEDNDIEIESEIEIENDEDDSDNLEGITDIEIQDKEEDTNL